MKRAAHFVPPPPSTLDITLRSSTDFYVRIKIWQSTKFANSFINIATGCLIIISNPKIKGNNYEIYR
jgi:hypothetical protein